MSSSSMYSDTRSSVGSSLARSSLAYSLARSSYAPSSLDSADVDIPGSPMPGSSKPPALRFDRNSVIDATLFTSKGVPAYTVVTNKSGNRTDICDIAAQCIVATIKRRELFSDTVKFPARNDGNAVAIGKWLRPLTLPHLSEPCTSLVTDLGNFVWKTDASYRLGLYREEDQTVPIAYMKRIRDPQLPVLTLSEGWEEMVEDILVSFIILEQRLRMKEKRRQNGMMYAPLSETGFS